MPEGDAKTSRDRLVDAVLIAWETIGSGGISVRQISQLANVPVSSIYHHFGSLEHLFLVAQHVACDDATQWCDAIIDDLADCALGPDAFASLLATIIDDWANGQRRLAFAWRVGQLYAPHSDGFLAIHARWRSLWSQFWQVVCDRFGVGHMAVATDRLFDGESYLHMFRWRRPVDRAALDELCRGWAAWLAGSATPASPWRDLARAEAIRAYEPLPDRDDTTARIASAAADLVAAQGANNLTHRAVAAAAGLTLGVVSYKFRTSTDLLRAAFETIYSRIVAMNDRGEAIIPDGNRATVLTGLVDVLCRGARDKGAEELFVAVARDPLLRPFAAQLRYLRGRTTGRYLQALLGPDRTLTPLDAALFSGFASGLVRAHANLEGQARAAQCRLELDHLVTLLDRRSATC